MHLSPAIKRYLKDTVAKRLPFTTWIGGYDVAKFRGDFIAGLAVGLMVVPQSLAISAVAGFPPHYGLYSSFPGPFVYFFLGTGKDMNVGPTMISALVASRYNSYNNPNVASILTLISGVILVLAGFFRLGFIVRFVSMPVFSAFIAAAAINISVNQLQDLLGLPPGPRPVFQRLAYIFKNIKATRAGDASLGFVCFLILVSLGIIVKRAESPSGKRWPSLARKSAKVLNISKSALIAILATLVSFLVYNFGDKSTFKIAGKLPGGFPAVQSPLRQIKVAKNTTLSASDSIASLGAGIGMVPLMLYLESIAVAKALAMRNRYEVDASQELIAIGACNIVGSFFNAFPATGSFARSAVNSISGAASPASGLVTGTVVVLALLFITSVFQYIPITALAAMVTASVLTMIDFSMPARLWAKDRIELLPYMAAFCASFYEMEFGVIAGTIVSLCVLLCKIMKPSIRVEAVSPVISKLYLKGLFWFPSSDNVTDHLQRLSQSMGDGERTEYERCRIHVDCSDVEDVDFTVAQKVKQKILQLEENGIAVDFLNVPNAKVRRLLLEKAEEETQEDMAPPNSEPDEMKKLCFETPV